MARILELYLLVFAILLVNFISDSPVESVTKRRALNSRSEVLRSDNNPEQQRLNDNEFQIIVYTYYVVGSLNAIGCSFVFCKTFIKWMFCKKNKNRLTMSYRLPFYTAISDFGIFISGAINIAHTAIYARVWEQPMCTIVGALSWFFVSLNLSLYGVISIMTYIRVCRDIFFDTGKYDYKLWTIVFLIITILQIIAGPFYGPEKYWCIGKSKNIVFSWTPVQVSNIGSWCNIDKTWIYVVAVIGVNLGGIGNAIQYMINERKTFHPTQYKSTTSLHIKTKLDEESYPSPASIELNDLPINIIIENNNEINVENVENEIV
ncbi:10641_t:CDS:2 [Rhizophagus irregularis]|nr:10641_t:CDS:2 [Rhizophagus irregularis]